MKLRLDQKFIVRLSLLRGAVAFGACLLIGTLVAGPAHAIPDSALASRGSLEVSLFESLAERNPNAVVAIPEAEPLPRIVDMSRRRSPSRSEARPQSRGTHRTANPAAQRRRTKFGGGLIMMVSGSESLIIDTDTALAVGFQNFVGTRSLDLAGGLTLFDGQTAYAAQVLDTDFSMGTGQVNLQHIADHSLIINDSFSMIDLGELGELTHVSTVVSGNTASSFATASTTATPEPATILLGSLATLALVITISRRSCRA